MQKGVIFKWQKLKFFFHSSIRISGEKTVYFDPYKINGATLDADAVYITHDHFDHYSEEDIKKVMKEGTVLVVPLSLKENAGKLTENIITVKPGDSFEAAGIPSLAVRAYNVAKPFHPKKNDWLGYIVTIDGERFYVAGDTDVNEDNRKVSCDTAFVPIGGHFTMDAKGAAELVNTIRPARAIPTHYGEVAGKPEDAEAFAAAVDKEIKVEIQLEF